MVFVTGLLLVNSDSQLITWTANSSDGLEAITGGTGRDRSNSKGWKTPSREEQEEPSVLVVRHHDGPDHRNTDGDQPE